MASRRVTMSERAAALRQSQELAVVQRKAVTLARRITAYIRREAVQAFKQGRRINPQVMSNQFVVDLMALLEKAMQVSILLGVRRMALSSSQQSLQLDQLDEQLKAIRQLLIDYYSDKVPFINTSLQSRVLATAVELVRGAARDTQIAVRDKVNELIREGSSVRSGIRALEETFVAQGLSGSEWKLETIIRTQTQLAYNGAQYQAAQSPAVDEILWGYKYVTVGDDRVRPEHEQLDGITLPKEHPFWRTHWPPNGYNCRCAVIPLYESRPIVFPPSNLEPIDQNFAYNPGLI